MTIRRILDKHHRGQIIYVPRSRYLNQTSRLPSHKWLHPCLCLLRIINLRPRVPRAQPIHLAILMRHRVIILNAIRKQQLDHFRTGLPPRRDNTTGRLTAEVSKHFEGLVEDVALLFLGHASRVFVGVAVQSYFVACVPDLGTFLWESLEGMARDEPGGFDVVFLEELEESGGSYVAGPEP